ncbi:PepSY domain-containing protein [uncultured Brevundimonas sp.]|uniref:PepSY domain-containing protein n=1 Tax=uncultured Brevundimonas sp. TaxID=213418 RepID=UPI0025DC04D7|nr:PepSY domain-containing protein [uncultured Brevundimonas sp.]
MVRWPSVARKAHKWLALIIGVQALFWVVSGLYMTAVHIDIIHGDHLVRTPVAEPISMGGLVDPAVIVKNAGGAQSLRLDQQLGQPVYIVSQTSGRSLFDARTGEKLPLIDEAGARQRAEQIYAGDGGVREMELLYEIPGEIRGRAAPIWRVQFEGLWRPTLYIAPQTGELVAKRHDLWRTFDFVWMFHIMDYETRDNVNNLLLKIATWMMVVTSLTGAWLLLYSFRRKRRVRKAAA